MAMLPLTDALGSWHDFYALLGTASATMVGLLFVAVSVGSGAFSRDRRAPLRVFVSASVVHFSSVLAVSLIVLAPVGSWTLLGVLILGCSIFGLGYSGFAWRDMVRDGLSKQIELDDRVWYVVFPVVGYLFEAASGIALTLRSDLGCAALATAAGMLLGIGIHNAWDITVWAVTRRRE
ncbi:MAG TPA: hypothetical protein VMQ99_18835 [Acetobacteraceae bacterium]|jgi:hypothetical protein|nr:hypothetical protein [Acetobacteraceae bacterium]